MRANTTSFLVGMGGAERGTFCFSRCVWCGEWTVQFPLGHSTLDPSFFPLLLGRDSKQRVPNRVRD